jgi:hypothetical protein
MSTRYQRTPRINLSLVPGSTERAQGQLVNRVQNVALEVTVEGVVTATAADLVRVADGRITNALQLVPINENGTDMVGECAARQFRLLSEAEAAQPYRATLPAATYTGLTGTVAIRETFRVNFGDPKSLDPFEFSYMEADPNVPLYFMARFNTATPLAALFDVNAGSATLGTVTISVRQVFDPARTKLPLFTPRFRTIAAQSIVGANSDDLFRLPTRQRVAALVFSQDGVSPDTGARVPYSGYVNALRLIGDDGRNIIGPAQEAWDDLVDGQSVEYGGEIADDTYVHNFQTYGRGSYTIVPEREYPNFRAEVDDDASGAAGTSPRLVIMIKELIARAPVNGYATVMPRLVPDASGNMVKNPDFPDWAL